MKQLPVADPGVPDHRSATRYLLWLAGTQADTIAAGMLLGVLWMVSLALVPAAVGRAVDAITAGDRAGLLRWSLTLLGLGLVRAGAGVMRHRVAVTNWLAAAYRTVQLTAGHAARLGATLPRKVATGEVVTVGTADISHIGHVMDITARGAGAVAAILVVAALLLHASPMLGLVVVAGLPLLMAAVALLLRPLHHRQHAYRELSGRLTGQATDIVAGLRVLRGVGGEAAFAARYRSQSQGVRSAGVRLAVVESYLEAAQILLPGMFIALITWLGARLALAGRISPGELVAFYGYVAFLGLPLRMLTETANKVTRGHVSARRVVRILALRREVEEPSRPRPAPPDGDLADPDSGVLARAGELTAVAAADPADAAAIAARLGRYTPDSAVTLAGVPLAELPLSVVRGRILLAENDALLFRGRLADELVGPGDPDRLPAAVHAAAAEDILAALPAGLDTEVAERGREFSGGQQQRLRLVRALVADPPVLILVEPTSAVDAHTEARIAQRLRAVRAGRTTVVCTTSPLLLDRADRVLYVAGGRVLASGSHAELLDREPRYAATVTRGEDR